MKTKIILLFACIACSGSALAQHKIILRNNAGIASGTSIIDGYYFSIDVGIPLIRSLEIAPTFTFSTMMPNTFMYNSWSASPSSPSYAVPMGGPRKESEYGDMLSSLSLLLFFKPFELFESEKLKKHEIMIGAGYGYKVYTMVSSRYTIDGNDYELTGFSTKASSGFEPYYLKLAYNYLFRENLQMGIVAGLDGYDGDLELLTGLQFGVRF